MFIGASILRNCLAQQLYYSISHRLFQRSRAYTNITLAKDTDSKLVEDKENALAAQILGR